MSRIGIKGFTLVEVMVTAAVLSLGATLLYQAFFLSLETFDYCVDSLRLTPWAEEKVWEAQDELMRRGASAVIDSAGEFKKGARVFEWELSYAAADEKQGLYRVELGLSWRRGQKRNILSRTAYAAYKIRE